MSSHHFVKEGQEPALFIIHPISLKLIQPLLEWAPLIIVLDSVLDEVMHWGIKIDAVLTFHSQVEKIEEKIIEQVPVKIISYEEGNAIAKGFDFLISSKQTGVTVVVESFNYDSISTRVQDLSYKLHVVLLTHDLKWSFIEEAYRKWFPAHTQIKVKPSCDNQRFSTAGVSNNNSEWYEVQKDGPITIQSENNFWIGEQFE